MPPISVRRWSLVVLVLISAGVKSNPLGFYGDRDCYETYVEYFTSLSPLEVRTICHIMDRVRVDEEGQQQQQHLPPTAAAIPGPESQPTPQELRDLLHVDDDFDKERRRQQLMEAQIQEERLRQRDRYNLAMSIFMDNMRPDMGIGGGRGRGMAADHMMDTAAFVPDRGYSDYMTTSYAPMSNDIVLRHSYLYN